MPGAIMHRRAADCKLWPQTSIPTIACRLTDHHVSKVSGSLHCTLLLTTSDATSSATLGSCSGGTACKQYSVFDLVRAVVCKAIQSKHTEEMGTAVLKPGFIGLSCILHICRAHVPQR